MKFIETQFFPYILKNKIKFVVCCGDFFHSRERIDWYILNEVKKRIFQWFDDNNIDFHILTGNHDTYNKNSIDCNSLTETVKAFKRTTIHDKTNIISYLKYKLAFVPWITDTKSFVFPGECDILFAHLELMEFPVMKGIMSKEGYDHTTFNNYNLVFSGHYHTLSSKDNVHMVGTPYQLTWNDYDTNKGFYVLDDNFNYEFVENIINPKHIKIYYENGNIRIEGLGKPLEVTKEESLEYVKNNYSRIYVVKMDNELDLDAYHTSILNVSCNDYVITRVNIAEIVESFDSSEFDEKFAEEESTLDLIISCISGMTFEDGIDKDRLASYSKKFYKQAFDEALVGEDD